MSDEDDMIGQEREVKSRIIPSALTREDVVGVCLDFYGDLPTVEQRNAIVQLRDTDAALRATITQQAQELAETQALLERFKARTWNDNVRFIAESREFLLQQYCNLQILYGEQKHEIRKLKATLAAREAVIEKMKAELNETWIDEWETVWTRPTAWAYAMVCKARDRHAQELERLKEALYKEPKP